MRLSRLSLASLVSLSLSTLSLSLSRRRDENRFVIFVSRPVLWSLATVLVLERLFKMALVFAAEIGDLEQVKSLVSSCDERNGAQATKGTNPTTSVQSDGASSVELLVNEQKKGKTALLAAVSHFHYGVVEFLLSVGADPCIQTNEGVDALMVGCSLHGKAQNHHEVVQLLLSRGANPCSLDKKGESALYYAARKGCQRAVKMILAQLTKQQQQEQAKQENSPHQPPVNLLKNMLDRKNAQGLTPVMSAAARGFWSVVNILCAAGCDASIKDNSGNTALHWAAHSGKRAAVGPLLSAGGDLEARNHHGLTCIKMAAAMGKVDFVQELLVRGATLWPWGGEPDPSTWEAGSVHGDALESFVNPRSAIMLAASNGHIETVQLLLSHRIAAPPQICPYEELADADRVAVLNCHDEVHRFLAAGWLVPDTSQQQHVLRSRAPKLKRRCTCDACDAFFSSDGSSEKLASSDNTPMPENTSSTNVGGTRNELTATSTRIPSLPAEKQELSSAASSHRSESSRTTPQGPSSLSIPESPPEPGIVTAAVPSKSTTPSSPSNSGINYLGVASTERHGSTPKANQHSKMKDGAEDDDTAAGTTKHKAGVDDNDDDDDDEEEELKRSGRFSGHGDKHQRRREKRVDPRKVFDPEHPGVKNDILRIIGMYLEQEGFSAASLTLQDEAQIKLTKRSKMHDHAQQIHAQIQRGEWDAITKDSIKIILGRMHRSFLYALYKQEYLEMVARGAKESAFSFLHRKLKPLEGQSRAEASHVNEFADLCYLLTCKSVQDAPSFRTWDAASGREKLAADFKSLVATEYTTEELSMISRPPFVAEDRLVELLQQAVAYQLEFSAIPESGMTTKVETLLEDYTSTEFPRTLSKTFLGHKSNVKCVTFMGDEGRLLASGSSDRTIMLWAVPDDINGDASSDDEDFSDQDEDMGSLGDSDKSNLRGRHSAGRSRHPVDERNVQRRNSKLGARRKNRQVLAGGGRRGPDSDTSGSSRPEMVITGHTSRVWDLASDRSGRWLCSASGDSTVRLWDVWDLVRERDDTDNLVGSGNIKIGSAFVSSPNLILNSCHQGDVYGVEFHDDQKRVVSAGYDKSVRLLDLQSNQVVKAFFGHSAAVTHAKFNPLGNLIVSGSKDRTIKFWDAASGSCIRTFNQPVGEITSLDVSRDGLQVLSSSKDSSIRLWDVRTGRSIRRFGGYQNSSLNFIRARFGPREALVFSGSEDGKVHCWDTQSGNLLAKLRGHTGPVFHAAWNNSQSMLASCSGDGTVRCWKP